MLFIGNRENRRFGGSVCLLILAFNLCLTTGVFAQPAGENRPNVIARGDVLQLSVPGHPEFEVDLTVGGDGRIELPGIGGMLVVDLTEGEAVQLIRQRLRLFDPTINNISLSLGRSGIIQIHIIGEVAQSGAHEFITKPSLWDVLRAAGGPTATANMTDARIVREVNGRTTSDLVDLSNILNGQDIPDVQLQDGDTLVVPALPEGTVAAFSEDGVHVFGGVLIPSVVSIDKPTPLLDVLMLAGAPSEDADLVEVFWVHREGNNTFRSTEVDLQGFMETGNPIGNPLIYPGDSVQVSFQEDNWVRRNIPFIIGSIAGIFTIWLAYDRLTDPRYN